MRDATILENNIVQTAGSAGESIAFGVGVTMPAILILGFDLELTRVMLVAVLGGLLGILMMIPLRRALIVAAARHPEIPRRHRLRRGAEGRRVGRVASAASQSAKREQALLGGAGDTARRRSSPASASGSLYKALKVAFKGWKDVPEKVFGAPFKAGSVSAEISPELLGVGYIIGPRIASIMCAGGVLAYLVLIPVIKFFGEALAEPLAPGTMPIGDDEPGRDPRAPTSSTSAPARSRPAASSACSRSLPTIWHGSRRRLAGLPRRTNARQAVRRRAPTATCR